MKIIFLDIDGVVATPRAWSVKPNSDTWTGFIMDPVSIAAVNKLCELYDAKIVISSTWQFQDHAELIVLDLLCREGLNKDYVYSGEGWRTVAEDSGSKATNIKTWLANHSCEQWVCLDDMDISTADEEFDKHVVTTDAVNGILHQHFQKAGEILRGIFSDSKTVWSPV